VAQGPSDVWLLGEDNGTPHLLRLEGGAFKVQPLPKLDGPPRSLAAAGDGTLWLVSAASIWKRYPPGEWEAVAPPDSRSRFLDVSAGGSDVWIAATHDTSTASRHVVLRLRPAKEIVRW